MVNAAAIARGDSVRRAILAVARKALADGSPMPAKHRLATALGIGRQQVLRHQARLVADGSLEFHERRTGRSRALVKRVAP